MKHQIARGTRDLYGEEKIARDSVVETLKKVFAKYGFAPLETPLIERYATLSSKYAGGAEILKETFKLKDQGDRELGLRYDLTVPLCRFIAMNPTIKMPFKRYEIGSVYRDGPIKAGRYRQFVQCDVDIVGVNAKTAEAELIMLAQDAFKEIGLDVVIKVNNRKILNGILDVFEISDKESVILTIDKLDKIGADNVKKELKQKGVKNVDKLMKVVQTKGNFYEKVNDLMRLVQSKEGITGIKEIEELFGYLKSKKNVEFDTSLARGLVYYTGTVFEVFLKKGEIKSAIAAGGRFDEMIPQFLETKREYPAVGISFGLDVISDVVKKGAGVKTPTKVFVIPIKTFKKSLAIAQELRDAGVNTEIDLAERGISRNLDYANTLGIPYVVFIGAKELKEKKVKLRDMKTGNEKMLSVEKLIKSL
ncbi:MAG: histidine--tRNA ligase [bacterium]|nr:histidine--tRNA ligase [bacterium]